MATPIYIAGFETAVFNSGIGIYNSLTGVVPITSTTVRAGTGARSMRVNDTTNVGQLLQCDTNSTLPASLAIIVGSVYFRRDANTPGGRYILTQKAHTATTSPRIQVISNGTLNLVDGDGGTFGSFQTVVNVWHRIDWKVDISANPWVLSWSVDGVAQTGTTVARAADTFDYFAYGLQASTSGDFYFDDLVLSGTAADYPLGECIVLGATADQTAAAAHQSIVATETQYTDDFSAFTNLTGASETDSRSRLDDLNTTDGIRVQGALSYTLPTFRAAGAAANGTTGAITPGAPAGIATGDLEVLVASTIAGGSLSITTNGGGAWTAMPNTPIDVTAGEKLYVWYRIRAGGDTDPQVTPGSDHSIAQRGCYTTGTFDPVTPVSDSVNGSEATSDTSFSFAPGYNTPTDNCLVACVCTSGQDTASAQVPVMANTSLTSLTLRANSNTLSGGGGGFGWTDGTKATAGTAGTFTTTIANASPKAYVAWTVRGLPVYGALTGNLRWPVETPAGAPALSPLAVKLYTVSQEASAGTNNVTFRTELGGSTTNHFSGDPGWGTTWTYLGSLMTAKPGTGVWLNTDIDAMNFEVDSTDGGPAIHLGGFIYEIAYQGRQGAPEPIVMPITASQRAANW